MDEGSIFATPLLAGFLGLAVSWLILGFFLSGVLLAVLCIAIALAAFAVGLVVMKLKGR